MTESGDQNIRSLFSRADGQRNLVEGSRDPNSEIFRENLASAIATYEECRVLADRLLLFSQNETLEDIATGDLQYVAGLPSTI
jgi:immunoglobulin-binding protein 1